MHMLLWLRVLPLRTGRGSVSKKSWIVFPGRQAILWNLFATTNMFSSGP